MSEIVFFCLSLVSVNEIGDLLKGEKGDRKRQDYVVQKIRCIAEKVNRVHEKIGVFEIAQQPQINRNADNEYCPPGPFSFQGETEPVIEKHGKQDEPQVERIPPPIEDEGCPDQP